MDKMATKQDIIINISPNAVGEIVLITLSILKGYFKVCVTTVLALSEPLRLFVFISHSSFCIISSASSGGSRKQRCCSPLSAQIDTDALLVSLQGPPGPAGPHGPPGADGVKASLHSKCDLIAPKGSDNYELILSFFFKYPGCLFVIGCYSVSKYP